VHVEFYVKADSIAFNSLSSDLAEMWTSVPVTYSITENQPQKSHRYNGGHNMYVYVWMATGKATPKSEQVPDATSQPRARISDS
jgi:hypothetical protein